LYEEGNRYERGLKKSMKNMEKRYESAGFQDAFIQLESRVETKDGASVRSVTFEVDEGTKSTVASLKVTGNKTLRDKQMKKLMQTRPKSFFHRGDSPKTSCKKTSSRSKRCTGPTVFSTRA